MSLDSEDLAALDRRMMEVGRASVAGAARLTATALRGQSETLLAMARGLEDSADRIEAGVEDPPRAPVRLQVVPLDDDENAAFDEAPEPGVLQRVEAGETGGGGGLLFPLDHEEFTPDMKRFLDQFDDRLRGSPHFVDAVNEAAQAGLPATADTARWVQARIYELREQTRMRQDAPEGGEDGE